MDEPFAALDEITRFKLNNDLLALWARQRWTVVFVTHSVYESVYLSSRIAIMTDRPGRVLSEVAHRRAVPARRGVPDVPGVQRLLPDGVGRVGGGDDALVRRRPRQPPREVSTMKLAATERGRSGTGRASGDDPSRDARRRPGGEGAAVRGRA